MKTKSRYLRTILALALAALVLTILGCAAGNSSGFVTDPRAQYDLALREYHEGKYTDAIKQFQRLLLGFPGLSYIDSAQYYYADSYYKNGDYQLAIAEYRRLVNNFPNSELVDDSQYLIGRSYFESAPDNPGLDQTDTEAAVRWLRTFLEDYPYSARKVDAQQTLSQAIERIATKQFKNGKQYFKLGYLDAARIYFEDLVTSYPEANDTPEALFLLARIDEKQDKLTDARDKLNNLINAFPDSEFAGKAKDHLPEVEKKLSENKESSTGNEPMQASEEKSE